VPCRMRSGYLFLGTPGMFEVVMMLPPMTIVSSVMPLGRCSMPNAEGREVEEQQRERSARGRVRAPTFSWK